MGCILNDFTYFVSCGLQKPVGCSWLSGKEYLCYDADKGWRVRYFNVLHRFLRSVFGFYKSTHLDGCVEKFSEYSQGSHLTSKR